jgi:hypothetical protein
LIRAPASALLCSAISACNLAYPLDGYQTLPREGGADAAPVELIQQETAQGSATRAVTVSLPRPVTIGDALVLASASVEAVPTSVSGGGATWKQAKGSQAHVPLSVWIGFVNTAGTSAVTATWAATQTTALLHASEWKGATSAGPAQTTNGTATAITPAALPTDDDAVLVFAAAAAHQGRLGAPTEGFIALKANALNDTQLATAYLPRPAPGLHPTSWSYESTMSWEAIAAVLLR